MRNLLRRAALIALFAFCLLSLPVSAFATDIHLEEAMPEGGKAVLIFATPLQTMTEIPFSVKLIGATGKVFSDATINLRLVMPAMAMPNNNLKALWQENAYRSTAIFTMAGEWEAIMIIQRPGHEVVNLTFKLGEVLMQ